MLLAPERMGKKESILCFNQEIKICVCMCVELDMVEEQEDKGKEEVEQKMLTRCSKSSLRL